jgi:translation initiation factor eIF-2B subunit delta
MAQKMEKLHISVGEVTEKPKTSKAERRAIQESQRAAKEKLKEEKASKVAKIKAVKSEGTKVKDTKESQPILTTVGTQKVSAVHKVRLFKHLYTEKCDLNINVNSHLHPAILKLGMQYMNDSVVGSNARCYAFLNAMITVSFFLNLI